MQVKPRILFVEDDPDNRAAMARVLQSAGYKVVDADDAEKAVDILARQNTDILITDLELPGMNGIDLLKAAKAAAPDVETILITGHGTVELAVEALRLGAYDFIAKPVRKPALLRAVERAAEKQHLAHENRMLRAQVPGRGPRVVHNGSGMGTIMEMVSQVGPSSATVLITGESGTGKEVIAEAIHAVSPRRDRPLVKVSCAALPDTLLESELFGYEKGAFTGAGARKEGRFELAHGGTLFLDEIGEISPPVQVKLLRVLQDGRFERLGNNRTIESDVRIITATNKDLQREIAAGRFREDLYYRLNVINIHLPPLRERKSDIPMLAMHFLRIYSDKNRKNIRGFAEDAMEALVSYEWAGNVRELENAVERAVVFTNSEIVPLSVLPQFMPHFGDLRHALKFKVGMPLQELGSQAIEITLAHTRGDKSVAARLLGVSPRTIYRHLDRKQQNGEPPPED